MRTFLALLILVQATGLRAQTAAEVHGTWNAELRNNTVFLQMQAAPPDEWNRGDRRGGWNMGQTIPVDQLSGLPGNDERFTAATVKFELRREAGTIAFEGAFRDGRGAGLFTFVPRREYIAEMRRLGFNDDIPLWRQYQLAVHDVGPRYIAALKAESFTDLTLDQIQRSKNHGVSLDYIKAMKTEGYRGATIEEFVRTRDHGVTPAYVQEMRGASFTGATVEELVRARDHGVTPEYATDMKAIFSNLTLSQIVRMRDHGVTPGFVNHARARGFTTTDPDEIVRLKDRGLWKH